VNTPFSIGALVGTFVPCDGVGCFESSKIKKRIAMVLALEVNFALWIMIGCATAKAVQFVAYLI
jgi:hypothetical protein